MAVELTLTGAECSWHIITFTGIVTLGSKIIIHKQNIQEEKGTLYRISLQLLIIKYIL